MPTSGLRTTLLCLALALPAACADTSATLSTSADRDSLPATRWDHRPEAAEWTRATMDVLASEANGMISEVPADIGTFCPGYASASEEDRQAFWTGLLSALARYESGWRPDAAGAGGAYRGLLQISPATARWRGCEMDSAADLYDGSTNLACAVRIAAAAVERDGVVVGSPGNWGGVASDWPPLRNAEKRAEIAAFTRAQSYCAIAG